MAVLKRTYWWPWLCFAVLNILTSAAGCCKTVAAVARNKIRSFIMQTQFSTLQLILFINTNPKLAKALSSLRSVLAMNIRYTHILG